MKTRITMAVFCLAMALIVPWGVQADWQPDKSIMLYIGFAPGGGMDTVGRVVANEISKNTGWNLTVINKPGGGGTVALKVMKGEKADGYAIIFSPSEVFAFNPAINPKIGFDIDDFTYIAAVTRSQGALVTLVDKPWKTFSDAIAAAKSGQEISVAYQAPKQGLSMKAIEKVFGAKFTLVPVKGGAGGMKNLLGKHVDIAWSAGIHAKYVKAGQMKVLVAIEKERLALTPDIPTMRELGVKQVALDAMFTFAGPKNLPTDVVAVFAREIKKAVASEKINDLLSNKMAMETILITGEELKQGIAQAKADAVELIEFVKE